MDAAQAGHPALTCAAEPVRGVDRDLVLAMAFREEAVGSRASALPLPESNGTDVGVTPVDPTQQVGTDRLDRANEVPRISGAKLEALERVVLGHMGRGALAGPRLEYGIEP